MKSIISLLLLLGASNTSLASQKLALVEILFLNPGQNIESTEAFFAKAYKISQRYGSEPIAGMQLKKWLHGGSQGIYNADFIVGSQFPSQAAMNKMLREDKDYDALLFEKDALFDSSKTIIFVVEPMQTPD